MWGSRVRFILRLFGSCAQARKRRDQRLVSETGGWGFGVSLTGSEISGGTPVTC